MPCVTGFIYNTLTASLTAGTERGKHGGTIHNFDGGQNVSAQERPFKRASGRRDFRHDPHIISGFRKTSIETFDVFTQQTMPRWTARAKYTIQELLRMYVYYICIQAGTRLIIILRQVTRLNYNNRPGSAYQNRE